MQRRKTARKKGATASAASRFVRMSTSASGDTCRVQRSPHWCAPWLENARGDDAAGEAQRALLLNRRLHGAGGIRMFVLLNHAPLAPFDFGAQHDRVLRPGKLLHERAGSRLWTVEVERLQGVIDNENQRAKANRTRSRIAAARRRHADLAPEARIAAGLQPSTR